MPRQMLDSMNMSLTPDFFEKLGYQILMAAKKSDTLGYGSGPVSGGHTPETRPSTWQKEYEKELMKEIEEPSGRKIRKSKTKKKIKGGYTSPLPRGKSWGKEYSGSFPLPGYYAPPSDVDTYERKHFLSGGRSLKSPIRRSPAQLAW